MTRLAWTPRDKGARPKLDRQSRRPYRWAPASNVWAADPAAVTELAAPTAWEQTAPPAPPPDGATALRAAAQPRRAGPGRRARLTERRVQTTLPRLSVLVKRAVCEARDEDADYGPRVSRWGRGQIPRRSQKCSRPRGGPFFTP